MTGPCVVDRCGRRGREMMLRGESFGFVCLAHEVITMATLSFAEPEGENGLRSYLVVLAVELTDAKAKADLAGRRQP